MADVFEPNCAMAFTSLSTVARDPTACEKQRDEADSRQNGFGMVGVFTPACEKDGSFSKRQCHGSTVQCWCVDSDGNEMHATRGRPGPDHEMCEDFNKHCEVTLADSCHLPPSSFGECLAAQDKYFFNIANGKCESHTVVCR